MIIGQVLVMGTVDETSKKTFYYSPWFPAQGNAVSITCDLINSSPPAVAPDDYKFEIDVQTKKSEDADPTFGVAASALPGGTPQNITLGVNQQTTFEAGNLLDNTKWSTAASAGAGLQELVRFVYIFNNGETADEFVHFRMLVGSWLSN